MTEDVDDEELEEEYDGDEPVGVEAGGGSSGGTFQQQVLT